MNNRTSLSILLLILCMIQLNAQSNRFILDSVPDSLKTKMDAIVLNSKQEFNVQNESSASYSVKKLIAVLNKDGKHLAEEVLFYDDMIEIKKFKGVAYDRLGNKLEDLNKNRMIDQSAISDFSLYEDNRIKVADLTQNNYPYYIELEYEIQFKSLFYIPDFEVLPGWDESVVQSSYSITSPTEILPNYKVIKGDPLIKKEENAGVTTLNFDFVNICGISYEPYSAGLQSVGPSVIFSPTRFKYDKFLGDMSSWKSYGQWQLTLNKDRGILPEATETSIKSLVASTTNIEDKIKLVYEYVQNNTRYVSIQLGIGGWQPFPASTVDKIKYGDCKALSNYTKTLLEAVGIKSYYTKVYADDNPPDLYPDFAYNAFNHIILCVPTEQDTIWLECTSQTNPFGYLGTFTGDRDVLVVTESGGEIVHTPTYAKEENIQFTQGDIKLNANGSATAKFNISYTGLQSENVDHLISMGIEDQKKWLYKNSQLTDFNIREFNLEYNKKKIPVIQQKMEVEINKVASVSGKRIFLKPNLINRWTRIPEKNDNRKLDMVFQNEYLDQDSLVFSLPKNLHVEFIPDPANIETVFGKYSSSISIESNQLIYIRRLEINKGTFDKSLYNEYREFRKAIAKGDKVKVVFVNEN